MNDDSEENKEKDSRKETPSGAKGFLDGLSNLLEKLGDLAEKGEELKKTGEFQGSQGKVRGVYGFRVKTGLGKQDVNIEPFGNVHEDENTGETVVSEITEPLVDVFDEGKYVLVVAEMPGIGEQDVDLKLHGDILTLSAAKGQKKYRKEVLLPASFSMDQMTYSCRNGIMEVKLSK
ncbi:MAG: Hsp20/alpha crystallin family protein [Verrucomicrobia bacterium]|nr:Hsp20/alpha crystallin family protein [Verrucomicrobiota bacterium]MCF7707522.1 Hsp20/alpha crystallin family protein [Verrucomicrobiota bacterium]